jgi:PKD repeat protein
LQNINKKNLYKLLFIIILLGFIVSLVGCDWLSLGLLNVFDPQAQIRVNYTDIDLTDGEGTIALEVYSLNEVEFIGTGFEYDYYNGTTKISSLSKIVGATFYVAPSTSPGTPGPTTNIDLPLYYQDAQDYVKLNPLITEITCTISLIGTDGAGHSISKSVTFDLPALEPGIDFEPPSAVITVTPGTTGNAPFSVVLDASSSTDNRGIASYSWTLGDGTTGSGVLVSHAYTNSGAYIIVLTVTDYFGNKGYATEVITVGDAGDAGGPTAVIQVSPGTTGTVPFTVAFDASGSAVSSESDCSCSISSYGWDFGDTNIGTGIATTHTYISAGTYIVILTVTDSNGKVGYATVVITVTSEEETEIDEITVIANPVSNVPGGTSDISALVINTEGDAVPNGTTVYFYTNSGVLSASSADTTNGIATVTLTLDLSMQNDDIATVTAFIGSVNNYVEVTCKAETEVEKITLSANPESNVPGGASTITAIVTREAGGFVDEGTTVYFTTNSGELSAASATTVNGVATVELILDDNMQAGTDAKVTAFTLNSGDPEEKTIKCIDVIVTIYADDYSISEGETSNITAVVTETDGTPVDNGVIVIFFTDTGYFDASTSLTTVYKPTASGIATTTLTLNTSGDTATVTAKCGSRISNKIEIECE